MTSPAGIHYFFEDISPFELDNALLSSWIQSTVDEEIRSSIDSINIIFCSDEYLLDINAQYLDHHYYTDIITFPYGEFPLTGELFISAERVSENAKYFGYSFENELNRVIIHGILHLCGQNDKTEEDKKKMREKENYYLQKLEYPTS